MRYVTESIAIAMLLGAANAAHAGDIAGVVHDGEGKPAAGLHLSIESLGRETVSGPDGSYRFEDLSAGEHEIALALESGRRQFVTVEVADTGAVTRNIFQFTPLALSGLQQSAPAQTQVLEGEELDTVMKLADSMTRAAPQEWRWRDLDS